MDVDVVKIIEHNGKKYVRSEDRDAYLEQRTEEIQNIQSDIDAATAELGEYEVEELAEERTEKAKALIDRYGLDSSSIELVNVEDEKAFEAGIDFLMSSVQSETGDPSAGFGDAGKPPSGTSKKQYEQIGRDSYHKVRGR